MVRLGQYIILLIKFQLFDRASVSMFSFSQSTGSLTKEVAMRFINARGSFYEVGCRVGEVCRSDIPDLYERIVAYLLENSTVGSLSRMREIAMAYSVHNGTWSYATEFLRGLARGARVPFEIVAIIAYSEEISSEFLCAPLKCSTLVVDSAHGMLIGHNEDYEPHYYGRMVLLDVVFDGFPRLVCLTYPGMLPGLAGSLNACGIAITNNSLWPQSRPGLSKQVQHFRASLATSLLEATWHLALPPVALTSHYTVAHGPKNQAVSLEVSNLDTAHEPVSMLFIGSDPFYHTNHVLSLSLKEPDPAVVAPNHSLDRLERLKVVARELLPSTPEDMLDLFSADGILYRSFDGKSNNVTLATVVIRPQTGEFWVRDADPAAANRDWHFSV